jgi:beta-lactamase regulating signal transducer with metallopeptidase domain
MAWWVFQNLVATFALALVAIGLCRVFRPGPVARHALWLIVLVKFLTPPIVEWPWALPDPMGLSVTRIDAGAREASPQTFTGEPAGAAEVTLELQALSLPPATGIAPATAGGSVDWLMRAGIAWLAGSLWLLGIEAVRYRRVARQLRMATPPGPSIDGRVRCLAERLGVAAPSVRVIPGMRAPFIWPVGVATLVLPREWPENTTQASIDALLVHELAHLKRRDHYVAWMQLAAGVIWWWNPLFWYVRATLREQAELACDAWVISTLPDGRRAYAESLITLSGPALHGRSSPSMAAVVGADAVSRRMLERRLVMIMKGRTPLRLPVTGLVTLALAAALTLPAWASDGQQQPPPPPPAAPAVKKPAPPAPPPPAPAPRVKTVAPAPPKVVPPVFLATPIPVRFDGQLQRYTWTTKDGKAVTLHVNTKNLPEDARKVVEAGAAEEEAIRASIQQQIEAKHAETVKRLEALQDEYTKAGKLDEAVAIRDFLRSPAGMKYGLPLGGWVIKR